MGHSISSLYPPLGKEWSQKIRTYGEFCKTVITRYGKWTHLMKSALKSLYTQNVPSAKKVHELLTFEEHLPQIKLEKENKNCVWSPVDSKRDRYEYNTSEVAAGLVQQFVSGFVCTLELYCGAQRETENCKISGMGNSWQSCAVSVCLHRAACMPRDTCQKLN